MRRKLLQLKEISTASWARLWAMDLHQSRFEDQWTDLVEQVDHHSQW